MKEKKEEECEKGIIERDKPNTIKKKERERERYDGRNTNGSFPSLWWWVIGCGSGHPLSMLTTLTIVKRSIELHDHDIRETSTNKTKTNTLFHSSHCPSSSSSSLTHFSSTSCVPRKQTKTAKATGKTRKKRKLDVVRC